MNSPPKPSDDKVTIFHRINRLKVKLGFPPDDFKEGYIDPAAVERAQKEIDKREVHYGAELKTILDMLSGTWEKAQTSPNESHTRKYVRSIHNYSNNIKDLAETYDYHLMHYFGESLRDFCEVLDVGNTAHRTIVQAHIDVMWVTFHENIKDDGGPLANELKDVVAQAIKKYTPGS